MAVVAGAPPTSSRCRRRRRGRWSRSRGPVGADAAGEPVVWEHAGAGLGGPLGLGSASQRSLLTVVAATGPRRSRRPTPGPPARRPGRRLPGERVSFHSSASRTTRRTRRAAPCRAAGHRPPRRRPRRGVRRHSPPEGRPPVPGVDLGAVGVRRPAGAHDRAGLGVADDDLGGLGRGVDPGDERAIWHVRHSLSIRALTSQGVGRRPALGPFSAGRRPSARSRPDHGTRVADRPRGPRPGQCCSDRLHIVQSSVRIRRGWQRV